MTLIISRGLTLRRTWQPMDPDAAAYITAVEAADAAAGQTGGLEERTKIAIDNFVLGCKADGTWNAIKASCILAGARTRLGAMVPLVGTAPTSFNFVDADYDRKTGLLGDGSTKYLNSNRNNNADPQNNHHFAVHVTTAHSASSNSTYIGAGIGESGVSHLGVANAPGFNTMFFRSRAATDIQAGAVSTTGFIGVSRLTPTSFNYRFASTTVNRVNASETPFNGNFLVFGRVVGTPYINGRLAFYSIGESLDLALLDARVTGLITAIGAAF